MPGAPGQSYFNFAQRGANQKIESIEEKNESLYSYNHEDPGENSQSDVSGDDLCDEDQIQAPVV